MSPPAASSTACSERIPGSGCLLAGIGRVRFLFASCFLLPALEAVPTITRLTPPSGLFSFGDTNPPIIARFLPGQRFDLQATARPDAGETIVRIDFAINGETLAGSATLARATALTAPAATIGTRRAFSKTTPGIHLLTVTATQSNGLKAVATGNFEIVPLSAPLGTATKAKNIIIMIGDGMGIAARTAARIVGSGVSQGKAFTPLAMDRFPFTGFIQTHSLDSIVTDSSPGAACYSTGNKNQNSQEGVFPDDTIDDFDNPRIEHLGEFLARTQGKSLGLVTTTDVEDATPAAFAVHTSDRSSGNGIVDQYLDEAVPKANLTVLLGGGRRWFQPASVGGSARTAAMDYTLAEELATGWNVNPGRIDPERDLIADFRSAGFTYVATKTQLAAIPATTTKLLGLFHPTHLNTALDRIAGRRGRNSIVSANGFTDQPMLDEMTAAALAVLARNPNGFVLMVEGGSIDKQAHAMDTERWLLEILEFDRAIERVRAFVSTNPDTLALVTADHETGGMSIVGASRLSNAALATRAVTATTATELRDGVVGTYANAQFPNYTILPDGYPDTTDVNRKLIVTYGANADRFEDWLTKPTPGANATRGFLIPGQVAGTTAVHTANDVPISALGVGASLFTGNFDNTEVFFKVAQLAISGLSTATAIPPAVAGGRNGNLVNLATRSFVGTGSAALISGFAIGGTAPATLLVRAVGPTLANFNITGFLARPTLQILNSSGAVVASTDQASVASNPADTAFAATLVGAFALPGDSGDAVLLVTLPAGSYTAVVRGLAETTGIALLEIYQLP
ncbi:MAG: alkaline phosphatase [Opitutus sp.]|nr:alkaline phosphatase [Opitutus sp.]